MRSLLRVGALASATSLLGCGSPPRAVETPWDWPTIDRIARDAARCPRTARGLAPKCPELLAWHQRTQLFASDVANDKLLSLLEEPDPALREAVARKGFFQPQDYFADAAHASRLFAVMEKERDDAIGGLLGDLVARFDVERAGQSERLRSLVHHPSPVLRARLPEALDHFPTPVVVFVTKHLLDDTVREVRLAAIRSLGKHAAGEAARPTVCDILAERLVHADDIADDAMEAAAWARCAGMAARVLALVEARVAGAADLPGELGVATAIGASAVCARDPERGTRERGYAVLDALSRPAVRDSRTRMAAISRLDDCDETSAMKRLDELMNDSDPEIAGHAMNVKMEAEERNHPERWRDIPDPER